MHEHEHNIEYNIGQRNIKQIWMHILIFEYEYMNI